MTTEYAYLTVSFADNTVDPQKFKDYPDYIGPNATQPVYIIPQPADSITKAQAYTRFKYAKAALTEIGGVVSHETNSVVGGVSSLTITAPGTGFTDGTYPAEPTSAGSGTGLTVDVTVSGTAVTAVVVNYPGNGYDVSDTDITLDNFAGVTLDVAAVNGTASITPRDVSIDIGYQNADALYEYVLAKLDNSWFSDVDDKTSTVLEGIGWIVDQAMNGLDDPRTLPASADDAITDFRYEIIVEDLTDRITKRHQYGTTTDAVPSLITGQNVVVTETGDPMVFNPA